MRLLLFIGSFLFLQTISAQWAEKAEDISPLLIGEAMPDLPVQNLKGEQVSFHEVLTQKPSVVIVYRGGWCPYCNRHLAAVGQLESELAELGYQVIGICPELPGNLQETVDKNEIKYQIFGDPDGSLLNAMGLNFRAPERYGERLMSVSGGKNSGFLPVPSLFITSMEGNILFEHISPNYKERLSSEVLLAVATALAGDSE